MDRDVELSMTQAHEKWIAKTLVLGALALAAMAGGTCTYNEHDDKEAEVRRAQADAQRAHDESMKAMWEKQKPAEAK